MLCWREFAAGDRSLKVASCLAALDVREHFDNYLPPFAPPTDAVRDALLELDRADGILDAADDLAAGDTAPYLQSELVVCGSLPAVNLTGKPRNY